MSRGEAASSGLVRAGNVSGARRLGGLVLRWVLLPVSLMVAASPPATAQEFDSDDVSFGELDSHTSYSDGAAIPEDAYVHTRDESAIESLAVTAHNHRRTKGSCDWRGNVHVAWDHLARPPSNPARTRPLRTTEAHLIVHKRKQPGEQNGRMRL